MITKEKPWRIGNFSFVIMKPGGLFAGGAMITNGLGCYSSNWRVFTFWVCGVVVGAGVVQ